MRTCKHCRKSVDFADAWGVYWYHVKTQSVYCDFGGSLRAEPAKETSK